MRIHHLNCGTFCPFGGQLFDGKPGLLRPAELVCHCLLIETEAGLVLVDTGLGRKDVEQPYPRLSRALCSVLRPRRHAGETAWSQIRALGFRDTDVRHIVLTHLDFDHAGGIEDFPHATVHVYAEELNAATHPRGWLARRRYRPQQWDRAVQWKTYAAHGEPWYGFRCVRELDGLPPDILMVPLVGHTLGHCGVAVRDLRGDWLLMAGDAYFDHREMPDADGARARCPPGLRFYQRLMDSDRTARLLNQQRLRDLARSADRRVRLACAHDPVELEQARARAARGPVAAGEGLRAQG